MFKINSIKILLFLLLFPYFSNFLNAQVYTNTPSSKFSCTIGLTASDLINDSSNYSTGILFNAGFVYSLRLSEKLNVNIELLYSGKAVKTETPIVKYRYFYADIPLYLQYNFNDNSRANIGGQYSIFTNSIVSQIDGSSANGVNNIKYENIKNNDYGFLLGAEIDCTEKLTLTARYTLSSSTFFEKNQPNFGIFNLAFRYTLSSTYKQFFGKKEVVDK
jgi:hypothetical protein